MTQFVSVTALGLLVYWLAKQWLAWADSDWAVVIWIGACIMFAVIYDRRQAKMHQSTEVQKEPERGC